MHFRLHCGIKIFDIRSCRNNSTSLFSLLLGIIQSIWIHLSFIPVSWFWCRMTVHKWIECFLSDIFLISNIWNIWKHCWTSLLWICWPCFLCLWLSKCKYWPMFGKWQTLHLKIIHLSHLRISILSYLVLLLITILWWNNAEIFLFLAKLHLKSHVLRWIKWLYHFIWWWSCMSIIVLVLILLSCEISSWCESVMWISIIKFLIHRFICLAIIMIQPLFCCFLIHWDEISSICWNLGRNCVVIIMNITQISWHSNWNIARLVQITWNLRRLYLLSEN